jgi:hypothetical protein
MKRLLSAFTVCSFVEFFLGRFRLFVASGVKEALSNDGPVMGGNVGGDVILKGLNVK